MENHKTINFIKWLHHLHVQEVRFFGCGLSFKALTGNIMVFWV